MVGLFAAVVVGNKLAQASYVERESTAKNAEHRTGLSPVRNTAALEEFEAIEQLAQDHRRHHWCQAVFEFPHEVVEVHGQQLVHNVHVSRRVDGLEMGDNVGRV